MANRLSTMSRFEEPDDEPKIVAYCAECGEQIYEGQSTITLYGNVFCDYGCSDNYEMNMED